MQGRKKISDLLKENDIKEGHKLYALFSTLPYANLYIPRDDDKEAIKEFIKAIKQMKNEEAIFEAFKKLNPTQPNILPLLENIPDQPLTQTVLEKLVHDIFIKNLYEKNKGIIDQVIDKFFGADVVGMQRIEIASKLIENLKDKQPAQLPNTLAPPPDPNPIKTNLNKLLKCSLNDDVKIKELLTQSGLNDDQNNLIQQARRFHLSKLTKQFQTELQKDTVSFNQVLKKNKKDIDNLKQFINRNSPLNPGTITPASKKVLAIIFYEENKSLINEFIEKFYGKNIDESDINKILNHILLTIINKNIVWSIKSMYDSLAVGLSTINSAPYSDENAQKLVDLGLAKNKEEAQAFQALGAATNFLTTYLEKDNPNRLDQFIDPTSEASKALKALTEIGAIDPALTIDEIYQKLLTQRNKITNKNLVLSEENLQTLAQDIAAINFYRQKEKFIDDIINKFYGANIPASTRTALKDQMLDELNTNDSSEIKKAREEFNKLMECDFSHLQYQQQEIKDILTKYGLANDDKDARKLISQATKLQANAKIAQDLINPILRALPDKRFDSFVSDDMNKIKLDAFRTAFGPDLTVDQIHENLKKLILKDQGKNDIKDGQLKTLAQNIFAINFYEKNHELVDNIIKKFYGDNKQKHKEIANQILDKIGASGLSEQEIKDQFNILLKCDLSNISADNELTKETLGNLGLAKVGHRGQRITAAQGITYEIVKTLISTHPPNATETRFQNFVDPTSAENKALAELNTAIAIQPTSTAQEIYAKLCDLAKKNNISPPDPDKKLNALAQDITALNFYANNRDLVDKVIKKFDGGDQEKHKEIANKILAALAKQYTMAIPSTDAEINENIKKHLTDLSTYELFKDLSETQKIALHELDISKTGKQSAFTKDVLTSALKITKTLSSVTLENLVKPNSDESKQLAALREATGLTETSLTADAIYKNLVELRKKSNTPTDPIDSELATLAKNIAAINFYEQQKTSIISCIKRFHNIDENHLTYPTIVSQILAKCAGEYTVDQTTPSPNSNTNQEIKKQLNDLATCNLFDPNQNIKEKLEKLGFTDTDRLIAQVKDSETLARTKTLLGLTDFLQNLPTDTEKVYKYLISLTGKEKAALDAFIETIGPNPTIQEIQTKLDKATIPTQQYLAEDIFIIKLYKDKDLKNLIDQTIDKFYGKNILEDKRKEIIGHMLAELFETSNPTDNFDTVKKSFTEKLNILKDCQVSKPQTEQQETIKALRNLGLSGNDGNAKKLIENAKYLQALEEANKFFNQHKTIAARIVSLTKDITEHPPEPDKLRKLLDQANDIKDKIKQLNSEIHEILGTPPDKRSQSALKLLASFSYDSDTNTQCKESAKSYLAYETAFEKFTNKVDLLRRPNFIGLVSGTSELVNDQKLQETLQSLASAKNSRTTDSTSELGFATGTVPDHTAISKVFAKLSKTFVNGFGDPFMPQANEAFFREYLAQQAAASKPISEQSLRSYLHTKGIVCINFRSSDIAHDLFAAYREMIKKDSTRSLEDKDHYVTKDKSLTYEVPHAGRIVERQNPKTQQVVSEFHPTESDPAKILADRASKGDLFTKEDLIKIGGKDNLYNFFKEYVNERQISHKPITAGSLRDYLHKKDIHHYTQTAATDPAHKLFTTYEDKMDKKNFSYQEFLKAVIIQVEYFHAMHPDKAIVINKAHGPEYAEAVQRYCAAQEYYCTNKSGYPSVATENSWYHSKLLGTGPQREFENSLTKLQTDSGRPFMDEINRINGLAKKDKVAAQEAVRELQKETDHLPKQGNAHSS